MRTILAIGILTMAGSGFSGTVETPMTEDLDANGYAIFNVGALLATNVAAADIIAMGPNADVRAYGAIGDGITDDTSAIQDAINDNGSVLIPKGYTFVAAGLSLPANTTLFGGGTLKMKAGSASHLMQNTGGNITVRDLKLNGANIGAGLCGIYFNSAGAAGIRILNCLVHNFTSPGIQVDQARDVLITGNESYSNAHPNSVLGDGIYIGGSSNVIVSGNICRNNKRVGIYCTSSGNANSDYFTIANNVIEGHTYDSTVSAAIWVELTGDRQSRAVIANNVCRNNYHGIYSTDPSAGMAIVGNVVEGQLATGNPIGNGIRSRGGTVSDNIIKRFDTGVLVDGFRSLTVHGNYIHTIQSYGIMIISATNYASRELVVTDNQAVSNYYGIRVNLTAAGISNAIITDNLTRMYTGGNYGLSLSGNYKINNGVIVNNDFSSSYGITMDSPALVGKMLFANNIGAAVEQVFANTTISWQQILLVYHYMATNGITVTLPEPANGRVVTIKKVDGSGYSAKVQGNASQTITIDGATNVFLPSQWSTLTVASDGYNWYRR